jgi:hypothetical protein
LKNPDLFRDMSGSKVSAALARSAMELAASGAQTAADMAGKNFRRQLQFQGKMADVMLDNIKSGSGNAARGELDPTLAGGMLNANPDAGDAKTAGDDTQGEDPATGSSSPGGALGGQTPGGTSGGTPPAKDKDVLNIEFIEEKP